MHSKTLWNKRRFCGQLQNHVWVANFRGMNGRASILWEFSYFFMVLWCGRSCEEVCGTILWVGKQDDSTTLQSIYSMHRWPPLQRGRNKIWWRIVTCMLSNCLTYFQDLNIRWSVNKLARSISKWSKACDKRLCRMISYIHHTCEYKQYCHVRNTAKQCRLGLFSRLRFCRRSWGLKIYIRWNIVHFWKSYVCFNQLDVYGTNFSFAQFNRIRNHFFGCRIEIGRDSRPRFTGSDSWKIGATRCQWWQRSRIKQTRTVLVCVCGRHQNGQQSEKTRSRFGKFWWKTLVVQRESTTSNEVVTKYRDMFEARFLLEPRKTTCKSFTETWCRNSIFLVLRHGIHAKKCLEISQLHNVATPCMDDHQFKEEENESVGELSAVCSQIVLKYL